MKPGGRCVKTSGQYTVIILCVLATEEDDGSSPAGLDIMHAIIL